MKTANSMLLSCLLLVTAASAQVQVPRIPPHALTVNVVLFGHSWIAEMNGYQRWAFPAIPSQHIVAKGYGGARCQDLLVHVPNDIAPSTNAVFIMAATNDVIYNVPIERHVSCMESMIGQILSINPHMLILLSNVPPFSPLGGQTFGDKRSSIATYNQAYTTFPTLYPNNVVLVDMWTPSADAQGWGLPAILDGSQGVHFGSNGKDDVMGIVRDALYSGLAR